MIGGGGLVVFKVCSRPIEPGFDSCFLQQNGISLGMLKQHFLGTKIRVLLQHSLRSKRSFDAQRQPQIYFFISVQKDGSWNQEGLAGLEHKATFQRMVFIATHARTSSHSISPSFFKGKFPLSLGRFLDRKKCRSITEMIQANRMCLRVVKIKRHTFMFLMKRVAATEEKFPGNIFFSKILFLI